MTSRAILTVAEIADADRAAIQAGTSGLTLMERAGAAAAGIIAQRFRPQPVTVLCGPGNNGGDGYVVARLLKAQGWPVAVMPTSAPATADARAMAALWTGDIVTPDRFEPTGLIVDAMFGAGLSRPLAGAEQLIAERLAGTSADVVSIDVPSGVPGDTGQPTGAAICATLTITFHARKAAHVLEPGRELCGEVVVADIGLRDKLSNTFLNTPDLWLSQFPWPTAASHKHARGRLIVVCGDAWNSGAARLAARAGLRIGAGLVTILAPPQAMAVNAAHLEAVMLRSFETDVDLEEAANRVDAVVIGPAAGITDTTLMNVLALARTGAALVIDADAITVFQGAPGDLFSVLDRDDVLTPHPGEFERLFPGALKAAPERITAARMAARKAGSVVLLKGPDTVIAAPDGRVAVNTNGSAWLATAGSGDVLAGYIGGLVSQGMESFEAACAGAWIHAEAADLHGPGLISEDLPGLTPAVLRKLFDER